MRKLDQDEERLLSILARHPDKPYWPSRDACAEPFIMDTLKALVRKKYLTGEDTDDGPAFTITRYGIEAVT